MESPAHYHCQSSGSRTRRPALYCKHKWLSHSKGKTNTSHYFRRKHKHNFLLNHTLSSYYRSHTDAPSFLNRLQGNLSASQYGIESLVNLQKLSSQGVPTQQKTVVDYIYFSTQNPAHNGVSGMPSWFRLMPRILHITMQLIWRRSIQKD